MLRPLMAKFSIGLAVCVMAFGLVVGLIDPTATGANRTVFDLTLVAGEAHDIAALTAM